MGPIVRLYSKPRRPPFRQTAGSRDPVVVPVVHGPPRSSRSPPPRPAERRRQVLVLPGLSPVIGSTEAEARRLWQELNALSEPSVGLARLSNRFGGHNFSHLDLDAVLSVDDFPDPRGVQAAQSRAQVITSLVARERPTLRQLLHSLAGARGHFAMAGTPEQVADVIEDWFTGGAADGFNIMPPIFPALLETFIAEVVPLLQQRRLFRTEYRGSTLRAHYGLSRPSSQFFPDRAANARQAALS